MIFSLILFALTGVIAFFHYVQGCFSATISAILAALAAVVALGWYEQAAPLLFNAKIYDQAASVSLVVIFAAAYILPRLLIDSLVPGNVRLPVIVDKVGAAVMGLIAGLIATGIVAVAADALPFGPTIGMYSRFETADQNISGGYMGKNGQNQDTVNYDVIKADKIDPDDPAKSHVWLGQDDLVVNLEARVSADNGSLGFDHPFTSVHPDLVDELYAQRLGIQPGAKHSANATDQTVSVKGIYTPPKPIPQVDGEPTQMRNGATPLPATVTAGDNDHVILVVRMDLSGKDLADDTDNLLRFSSGAMRMVVGEPDNGAPFKNYFPVATLDAKGVAVACRPDDFLLADLSAARTIDFVFVVDRDHVMSGEDNKIPFQLPQGSFVEFKRYGMVDLSGKAVEYGPPPNKDKTPVIRKPEVVKILEKTDGIWTGSAAGANSGGAPSSAPPQAQAPAAGETAPAQPGGGHPLGDSGLSYEDISVSNKLAAPINCGTGNDSGVVQLATGVGGKLEHRQWLQLTVSADTPVSQLGTPIDDNVSTLAVDPNTVLVQVHCSGPVSGSASAIWGWGQRVSDFTLADATGHTYPCVGAWATVQRSARHYLVVNYRNFDDQNHLQGISAQKGRPVDVWLAFQVPAGTPIAEIRFSANTVMDNLEFKAQ
ncbi:MAG: hypothetical protein ABSH08_12145 [Tepidisphaeraceae bacterium]|jgi:hypothetical protein